MHAATAAQRSTLPSVSLRTADFRFVLPELPEAAAVLVDDPMWRQALAGAGIDTAPVGEPPLAVCRRESLPAAIASGARAVVVLSGSGASALRRAGYQVGRVMATPRLARPYRLVPLGQPDAARAAFAPPLPVQSMRGTVKGRLGAIAVGLGIRPVGECFTVAVRTRRTPMMLAAAEAHGVPKGGQWWLSLGCGDELQRGVLHALTGPDDGYVVKFARVTGYDAPFGRDAVGLGLARAAGGLSAALAPELVSRFTVSGLAAAVETRAPGRRLDELLSAGLSRPAQLELVDSVAARLLGMAVETAQPAASLRDELQRLARDVAAPHASAELVTDIVHALPPVPGVLAHHDAGPWNVVVGPHRVMLVDWESASRPALPLWDLLYFLAGTLVLVDDVGADGYDVGRVLELFRGELATSPVLFRWVRRACRELSIPEHAVGPLATLAWLHHGRSPLARAAALDLHVADAPRASASPLARLAGPWLADDALGVGWSTWR